MHKRPLTDQTEPENRRQRTGDREQLLQKSCTVNQADGTKWRAICHCNPEVKKSREKKEKETRSEGLLEIRINQVWGFSARDFAQMCGHRQDQPLEARERCWASMRVCSLSLACREERRGARWQKSRGLGYKTAARSVIRCRGGGLSARTEVRGRRRRCDQQLWLSTGNGYRGKKAQTARGTRIPPDSGRI